MVSRRAFVYGSMLALVTPPATQAQQTRRVPRVGVVGGQSPEATAPILALRQGLRELGYVEGQTIAFEWRWAQGKLERFPDLVAELVQLKVDVIVAATDPAVAAAQKATRTIPVVMVFVTDPVALGFVANFARPGGNITGLASQPPEITGKRLQLLREVTPNSARIAVLGDPRQRGIQDALRETEAAARVLGVQLQVVEARTSAELDRAFADITRERAAGVMLMFGAGVYAYRARIAQLAAKHHLPTMSWVRDITEAGCLMSYGASLPDLARRAAYFVDKILKGAKPEDLPV